MAKTKGIFMGSSYENTIKKPWKYFEKFTINGPWNSLDYITRVNMGTQDI